MAGVWDIFPKTKDHRLSRVFKVGRCASHGLYFQHPRKPLRPSPRVDRQYLQLVLTDGTYDGTYRWYLQLVLTDGTYRWYLELVLRVGIYN